MNLEDLIMNDTKDFGFWWWFWWRSPIKFVHTHPIKIWYNHITGYWGKKLPHIPEANNKQFWNTINGYWK
jgi:hypothetical protein